MADVLALIGVADPELLASATRALGARVTGVRSVPCGATDAEFAVLAADPTGLVASGDGPAVGAADRITVAAVATLSYRADFLRRTATPGAPVPATSTDAALLAAAFRAVGARALELAEGEFAAVVWDAQAREVWLASDETGRRPLFHARWGGGLAVATTPRWLQLLPGMVLAPDLELLAERAAAMVLSPRRTAWAAIGRVGAGDVARWRPGGAVTIERTRRFARFGGGDARPADAVAGELATLLQAATSERLISGASASVWMSGGFDSPAVFASGQMARRGSADAAQLRPLSISFPVGSPGREDELIEAIARHWHAPVDWVQLDAPEQLVARLFGALAERDDPFAHAYGYITETLAERTRAAGARIALDGYGGDAVFYAGVDHYLPDLVRAFQWRLAWREWQAAGGRGRRGFVRWAILPNLPETVERWAARRLGGVPHRPFARAVPPWIRGARVDAHRLGAGAQDGGVPREPGESRDAYAIRWMLEAPLFQQVLSALRRITVRAGVSQRSPMLDARVVAFMARRPRADRGAFGDTKLLLRQAMADRLPPIALQRRPKRTGVPSDVLEATVARASEALLGRAELRLAELGVVDADRLRSALRDSGGRGVRGTEVLAAVQVEEWLRHVHA